MSARRLVSFCVGLGWLLSAGCSKPIPPETHRHLGPKINIADFISNTGAYKGKSITLVLKVDEPIPANKGQSLRDYSGRDVKFAATGSKGEQLKLVIAIPAGLSVPDVANADEVRVTFVCSRGNLRQGNEAKEIERP